MGAIFPYVVRQAGRMLNADGFSKLAPVLQQLTTYMYS